MNIFGTSFNYKERLVKVRKLMGERDMDAILVHLWPNQYYISGMYQHLPWYPVENAAGNGTPFDHIQGQGKRPDLLMRVFDI